MTNPESSEPTIAHHEWLVLVPTKLEQKFIAKSCSEDCLISSKVIGFGPIVSAARTIQMLQQFQPQRVLLLGIAGSYTDELSVGAAAIFSGVGCYGVGIGSGKSFQSAGELGWQQWPGDADSAPITDRINLLDPAIVEVLNQSQLVSRGVLLTTPAASTSEEEALDRLHMYPDAVAEDMEGFSVAAACHLYGVPLTIVRGISNRVGDRVKKNWKIEPALIAAVELAEKIIQTKSSLE